MYYRFGAQLNLNAGLIKSEANLSQTLITGRLAKMDKLRLPWPFSLRHNRSEPLQMSDYYPHVKLMSDRLVGTLKAAGVDNLQLFEARIVNQHNNAEILGYQVVNILGLVYAADEKGSKSRPLAHVRFFEKLVLDEARTRGQLMFRLAESLNDVIIAAGVAKRVTAGEFVDVTLEPLGPASA